jgi:hypothetical protein
MISIRPFRTHVYHHRDRLPKNLEKRTHPYLIPHLIVEATPYDQNSLSSARAVQGPYLKYWLHFWQILWF